uniref:Enoyl-[acyl-carrier-protein] reductase (NADH) n=1 Tax=Phaeomonas parva TaxID=124430 RepID=A0A7S1U4E4_9STRA|mmetsp:Transcript_31228/g.99226  ORF Transcript_31228/g.99226 Transcript_31228/m.99226 type:complete len:192 (+) Transcript_31228:88-663(+)
MLRGRRALVVGVTNHRSLGWAIARLWHQEGAEVTVTYQQEKQRGTIDRLIRELGAGADEIMALRCDVTSDDDVLGLARHIQSGGRGLDALCHTVAFANPRAMRHGLLGGTEEGESLAAALAAQRAAWAEAMDVSVFSLVALARELRPSLAASETGASVMTLSYIGADRAVPGYAAMGPAKAALQARARSQI